MKIFFLKRKLLLCPLFSLMAAKRTPEMKGKKGGFNPDRGIKWESNEKKAGRVEGLS